MPPPIFCNKKRSALFIFRNAPFSTGKSALGASCPPKFEMLPTSLALGLLSCCTILTTKTKALFCQIRSLQGCLTLTCLPIPEWYGIQQGNFEPAMIVWVRFVCSKFSVLLGKKLCFHFVCLHVSIANDVRMTNLPFVHYNA